jgi:hypothetical protein
LGGCALRRLALETEVVLVVCSEWKTSKPMDPNVEKMSAGSPDEPMSEGRRSYRKPAG